MTAAGSSFEEYRSAFARYDARALADLFAFPLHLVSVGDATTVASVASRDDWLRVLQGALGRSRARFSRAR